MSTHPREILCLPCQRVINKWAPSSEFVSSRIPSLQILTAHVQPVRGARDLAFCLKVPFDSLLVWASSGGSGETARMSRLAWTFAARISDKYQIRLTRSKWLSLYTQKTELWYNCRTLLHRSTCKKTYNHHPVHTISSNCCRDQGFVATSLYFKHQTRSVHIM